ncbi:MAG TPA: exopolysaccharide biosynthesis polyprenyl glycosylphosphotransferase [Geminicoccaceae bacterium]
MSDVLLGLDDRATSLGSPQTSCARRARARRSSGKRRVLVYGAGACGRKLLDAVRAQPETELQILAVFDDRLSPAASRTECPDVAGGADDLIRLAQMQRVDEVIVALPRSADARLKVLIEKFCVLPAAITIYDGMAAGGVDGAAGSLRRRVLLRRQHCGFYHRAKAIVDPLLAAVALMVALPLILVIALLIKLETPGPVLFRQARYGFKGKVFQLYKFRTLFHDHADPLGAIQAHPGDERVTRVGAVLRRICLDELPQLFNVLKGDMSLVGPRPHPIGMRTGDLLCHDLLPYYFLRYRVRPGMTGWAQVNGWRGAIHTPLQLQQRVGHDLYYIEHCSFRLDARILLSTLVGIAKSQEELQDVSTRKRTTPRADGRDLRKRPAIARTLTLDSYQ